MADQYRCLNRDQPLQTSTGQYLDMKVQREATVAQLRGYINSTAGFAAAGPSKRLLYRQELSLACRGDRASAATTATPRTLLTLRNPVTCMPVLTHITKPELLNES